MGANKPWVSGPVEILEHGLGHMNANTDLDRRLAMIAVDNAVELGMKTFLWLPARASGSPGLSRKQKAAIGESFPALLDAMEEHASDRLLGIGLDEIEFYHRLRNELYHGGAGLTVATDQIARYADLARKLFHNLFEYEFTERPEYADAMNFLLRWAALEQLLAQLWVQHGGSPDRKMGSAMLARELFAMGLVEQSFYERVRVLTAPRNDLVHAGNLPSSTDIASLNAEVADLVGTVVDLLEP